MKILCIEDDESLAKLLYQILVKQHYEVEIATDGETGWNLVTTSAYDLILLDWMLPKLTGIELCEKLRTRNGLIPSQNQDTPILLMTGLDTTTSKVMGLDAGADDYLVKPLDFEELLARIRALLRRKSGERAPMLKWGQLCLCPNSGQVTYLEQKIQLAQKEYKLLELFLRNPEQIFSLSRLVDSLWSIEKTPTEGAVRAHIKGLRQKLKQAGVPDPLETIYKMGYRLKKVDQAEDKRLVNRDKNLSSPYCLSCFQIPPELWEVWQECRQSYCDRASIIQQAVTALKKGTLTPLLQHQAEREAHTLAGSLGSFGLENASSIARRIEEIFKQPQPPNPLETEQLFQWTTKLTEALSCNLPNPNSCDLRQKKIFC